MVEIILIFGLAILYAWAGGSLKCHEFIPSAVAEIVFSLVLVSPLMQFHPLAALWAAPWSYRFLQAANANGLHWGKGQYKPERDTVFSPIVNWTSDRLGYDRSSVQYCRLYMAVKGFLVTLPVGGFGVIGFPLGYDLGERLNGRVKDSNLYRELFAGGITALFLVILW